MSTIQRAILVVSNDQDTIASIQTALADDYAIMTAARQEAITSIIDQHNNLVCIIMDQQILESSISIHTLKSNFKTIHIPVIILAKNVLPNDIVDAAEQGADDFVQKPIDAVALRARLLMNVRRAERDQNANPLTKLPGSSIINKIITQRLSKPIAILYADLNDFKAYNDKYGYAMGDRMIQQTAQILTLALQKNGHSDDFLGHIGGDDFIVISTPEHIDAIADYVTTHFDLHTKQLYNEHDLSRSKMIVRNRQGTQHLLPLISISLAVVTNEKRPLSCVPQIAQIAAELKQFAKNRAQEGQRNTYIKDRRQE
jgi:diguanylate cyclase (GGDEF)-like protein